MSARHDSRPAFPVPGLHHDEAFNGMSLRDYFAAQAMQGYLVQRHPDHYGDEGADVLASDSYLVADAMLKARNK